MSVCHRQASVSVIPKFEIRTSSRISRHSCINARKRINFVCDLLNSANNFKYLGRPTHAKKVFTKFTTNFIKFFSRMVQKGPRPLVLCGPSGSGKSTLLKRLLKEYPERYGFSVSHTTRGPRPGEIDGVHYHFTTKEDMTASVERGDFIETATFSGNMYGTSKRAVDDVRRTGKICLLDIDIEGVKQVKRTDLDPLLVFVMPPSIQELERRLRARNTENEDALRKRLEVARREIEFGREPGNVHIVILNDSLDKAYAELRDFIAKNVEDKNEDNQDENEPTEK